MIRTALTLFALALMTSSPAWAELPNACDPNFCNGKSGDPTYGACCDCYSDRVCLPINITPRVWNDAFVKCVGNSAHNCCKPSTATSFPNVPTDQCSSNAGCTEQDGDLCTIPTCATNGSWAGNDCPSGPTYGWDFLPTACREIKIGDPWFPGESAPDPAEYQCCKAGFGISGAEYQCCVDRVKAGGVVGTPAAGPHCPPSGSGSGGSGTTGSSTGSSGGSGTPSTEAPTPGSADGPSGTDEEPKSAEDADEGSVPGAGVPSSFIKGGGCGCRMDAGGGDSGNQGMMTLALAVWLAPLLLFRIIPIQSWREASRKYRTQRD